MGSREQLAVVAAGLASLGAVAALVTAWTGWVLDDIYLPHAPGADVDLMFGEARRSATWSGWHETASVGLLLVTTGVLVLAVWMAVVRAGTVRDRVATGALGAVGLVAALATVVTRPLVEWDQVALRAVTVGSNLSGYRVGSDGDQVRFVLVGGVELSTGQYTALRWVHLGAPVVAGLALAAVVGIVVRSRRRTAPTVDVDATAVPTAT